VGARMDRAAEGAGDGRASSAPRDWTVDGGRPKAHGLSVCP
jgi:hypothetical protein